jgi:hypothetical protein
MGEGDGACRGGGGEGGAGGETNTLVVSVRVGWQDQDRCGICRRRAPGFDLGRGRRRWRALDLGTTVTELEADNPRVSCLEHGVVVTWVPWARHGCRTGHIGLPGTGVRESFVTRWTASKSISTAATGNPSAAKRRTIAAPMPPAAPVTRATLPAVAVVSPHQFSFPSFSLKNWLRQARRTVFASCLLIQAHQSTRQSRIRGLALFPSHIAVARLSAQPHMVARRVHCHQLHGHDRLAAWHVQSS